VLLAATLRFAPFATRSLNADEATTLQLATLEWNTFLNVLAHYELNAAPYYLLLRIGSDLGTTEMGLRTLSLVIGLAALPLVIALGARFLNRRVGLFAAFLLAISPLHILRSQNARGYTLAVFLVLLSCFFFLESTRRPSWWAWSGYVAASALAVYTHFFAGLVLLAQWGSLPFLRGETTRWSAWFGRLVAIVLLLLPLGLFAVLRDAGQIDWIARPDAGDLVGAVRRLSGERWSLLVLFVLLTLSAAGAAWRERRARETRVTAFLLAWLLLPILLSFLISMRKPIFTASYLIVSLPALLLLAAIGLFRVPSVALRSVVTALILLLSATPLTRYYRAPYQVEGHEEWGRAVGFILAQAGPHDAVIIHSGTTRVAYDYYVRRSSAGSRRRVPLVVYPSRGDYYLRRPGPAVARAELTRALEGLPRRHDRIWVVLSHHEVTSRGTEITGLIQRRLAAHYSLAATRAFRGVHVLLFAQ